MERVVRPLSAIATVLALACFAGPAEAVLTNQYNFDNGTAMDSVGTRHLTAIGAPPVFAGGSYHSDGDENNYLEWTGGTGAPDFTVSVWINTSSANQGDFKGIFSNNDSSTDDFSFQFDSNSGTYRLVSKDNPTATFGTPTADTWENLVLQKFGGSNARIYFNGVQVGGNLGFNPGGLQEYRIGINRNSDNSFLGLIDNVQIWDDSEVDPADIFAAGPGFNATIPEPATATLGLIALGGLGALTRRRRA